MKKLFLIIPIILIAAVICLSLHFTVNPTIVRKGEDAALKIAESWLDKQISLHDHKVTEAHFYETRSGERYVSMAYDVQPRKNAFTVWYAGNGEIGEDGWLIEKSGLISYQRIGPFVLTGADCNTGP